MVWGIFLAIVTVLLALDLGVFNKNAHEITQKEATKWTMVWVTVALLFGGVLYCNKFWNDAGKGLWQFHSNWFC